MSNTIMVILAVSTAAAIICMILINYVSNKYDNVVYEQNEKLSSTTSMLLDAVAQKNKYEKVVDSLPISYQRLFQRT